MVTFRRQRVRQGYRIGRRNGQDETLEAHQSGRKILLAQVPCFQDTDVQL